MNTDSASNRWNQNIDRAMHEINGSGRTIRSGGVTLPNWVPAMAFVLLGILIARLLFTDTMPHPVAPDRDYGTGGRVALLMIAEDLERYRQMSGALPSEIPSPIAKVMDVDYEKHGDQFVLIYHGADGVITLDERNTSLTMAVD